MTVVSGPFACLLRIYAVYSPIIPDLTLDCCFVLYGNAIRQTVIVVSKMWSESGVRHEQ
jgi:hypothetical protein